MNIAVLRAGLLAAGLAAVSCSTHYLSSEELMRQMRASPDSTVIVKTGNPDVFKLQKIGGEALIPKRQVGPDFVLDSLNKNGRVVLHQLAGGRRLTVLNAKKDTVKIQVDGNTQISVDKKSSGKFQAYFTSTWLMDDILFGYRNRYTGLLRTVTGDDMGDVQIYSEFKGEEK